MKVQRISKTEMESEFIATGIADKQGRMIGAKISTWEETFQAVPDDVTSWYNLTPGTHLALRTMTTRNDRPFGAMQGTKYFMNRTERDAEIARYTAYTQRTATNKAKK